MTDQVFIVSKIASRFKVDEDGNICLRWGPKAGTPVSIEQAAIAALEEGSKIENLLEVLEKVNTKLRGKGCN